MKLKLLPYYHFLKSTPKYTKKVIDKKALLDEKIKTIEEQNNEIIKQLKSGKNLLLNEKIYIAAISYLENFSDMFRQLTEENLARIILAEDLKKEKALNILISLIESDKKKAIEVVKLMQKRNNYSFQKLYDELSSDQKAFSFLQNKIIRLFFNCFVIIKAINTSNCNCFITKNLKEKDERVDISKKKNKLS